MFSRLVAAFALIVVAVVQPAGADGDWHAEYVIDPVADPAPPPDPSAPEIAYDCDGPGACDLGDFLARRNVCALVVRIDGETVFLRRDDRLKTCRDDIERNRHGLASVAKSITAMIFGEALAADPDLTLETPVAAAAAGAGVDYPSKDVTVRDLLRMASNMRWSESRDGPLIYLDRGRPKTFAGAARTVFRTNRFRFREPGVYNYSGFDTVMLGQIARAAGDGGGTLLQRFTAEGGLWRQAGGAHQAKWKGAEDEDPSAYCCFQMAPEDLAAIGQVALDAMTDLTHERADWMRRSVTDVLDSDWACDVDGEARKVKYGYQWRVPPGDGNGFTAYGRHGQYLHIFPEQRAVVAQFSADIQDGEAEEAAFCETMRAHRALVDALAGG